MGSDVLCQHPTGCDQKPFDGVPRRVPDEAKGVAANRGEAIVHRPGGPQAEEADIIWEVRHLDWLANPVIVPKKGGKEHMCVDFTSLNKACPQDSFPLPCIDQIVDSTAECDLLCFLDAFSGFHQIKMAVQDVEKTAFLTPCGVYC